jgi:sigma-E factor negative regulatory protein RseA
MDTYRKNRERISALGDGELPAGEVELAMAALHGAEGRRAWISYHHIGDALRALPAPDLDAGFEARLAERLAREPVYGRKAAGAEAPAAQPLGASTPL